ncbi:MAG: glycosyltransferase family 4 protein [Oscillospiraceae bacterium]|nr:glycosyltransferase family 4 protein [Oscillospiraceae bacterium]
MIRVLNVISDSNIGGAGRVLLNYVRCSDRERFETYAAIPRGSLLKTPLEELGARVCEVDALAERSYHPKDVKRLCGLMRELHPDIVHTHGALSGRIAARRSGAGAVVMTKHCPASPGNAATRAAHRLIDSRLTDAVIAVSKAVGRQLERSGTPKELIHVVYNGIVPREPLEEEAQAALRQRLGMDDGHIWIGSAARLEPVKGVDLFLDAALRLARKRDDLRFMVFGTGSVEASLRAKAEPLGNAVRFGGFVEEIEQALALLDVTVVPSRAEAFCLTAAESLSMGTPVAAFEVDGVSEVVRDGETGLLAPAQDVSALADAIEKLADDAGLRARLGGNGQKTVRDSFSAERMARQLEAIYEQLLKKKER